MNRCLVGLLRNVFRWVSARREGLSNRLWTAMSKRFPGVPPSGTPVVDGGGVSSSTVHGQASVGADLLSDSDSVLSTTLGLIRNSSPGTRLHYHYDVQVCAYSTIAVSSCLSPLLAAGPMSLLLWTYEGSNDERKSAQRTGDSTYTQGTPFMTTRGAPLRSVI